MRCDTVIMNFPQVAALLACMEKDTWRGRAVVLVTAS
jgi:hypothetical protein